MISQPPLTDILQRVFCIKVNNYTGTAFSVPVGENICLVTAKHVVSELPESELSVIGIFAGKEFNEIQVKPHFCEDDIDIAVLQSPLKQNNSKGSFGLPLSMGNLMIGQDTYFLGFPHFGQQIIYQPQEINNNFPLPLVKKAIYSGGNNFKSVHYLDGHNNPGFSGGPVVFNTLSNGKTKQKICGVISAYLTHSGEIVHIQTSQNQAYLENSGIIISYQIEHAVDLIKRIYKTKPTANSQLSDNP
jgi:hypothetical protein